MTAHIANIPTSFRTANMRNHLKPKRPIADIFNRSGIYQLRFTDCPLKYVWQTGGTFNTRFREHRQVVKTSEYSQHTEWPESQLI
jgi:hypothetical protein